MAAVRAFKINLIHYINGKGKRTIKVIEKRWLENA